MRQWKSPSKKVYEFLQDGGRKASLCPQAIQPGISKLFDHVPQVESKSGSPSETRFCEQRRGSKQHSAGGSLLVRKGLTRDQTAQEGGRQLLAVA